MAMIHPRHSVFPRSMHCVVFSVHSCWCSVLFSDFVKCRESRLLRKLCLANFLRGFSFVSCVQHLDLLSLGERWRKLQRGAFVCSDPVLCQDNRKSFEQTQPLMFCSPMSFSERYFVDDALHELVESTADAEVCSCATAKGFVLQLRFMCSRQGFCRCLRVYHGTNYKVRMLGPASWNTETLVVAGVCDVNYCNKNRNRSNAPCFRKEWNTVSMFCLDIGITCPCQGVLVQFKQRRFFQHARHDAPKSS